MPSMYTALLCLGALILGGLGYEFIRKKFDYVEAGDKVKKLRIKRKHKILGEFLLVMAVVLLLVAALSQHRAIHALMLYYFPASYIPKKYQAQPVDHNAPTKLPLVVSDKESPSSILVREAALLLEQKDLDGALVTINAALQKDPGNPAIYGLRGIIYSQKKLYNEAEKDYLTVIKMDGNNFQAKFNLAELKFTFKKFDEARPGFVALEQDSLLSDLATYKVFLCDLYAGHEDLAAKELDAMNGTKTDASYYYGKAVWCLYHHQASEAEGWLTSAAKIYSPNKQKLYSASLFEFGYLPLHPS